MTPEEQVEFMLQSLKWDCDGFYWDPPGWDYRIAPGDVLRMEAERRGARPEDCPLTAPPERRHKE